MGKSSVSKKAVNLLQEEGVPAAYSKEPFTSQLKGSIATLASGSRSNAYSLACLIAADRYLHAAEIRKLRDRGTVVVSDRFLLSSLVYQSIDGVPVDFILDVNRKVPKPSIQFVIMAPLEVRKARLVEKIKSNSDHRFYSNNALQKEQQLYKRYGKKNGATVLLDGNKSIEATAMRMVGLTLERFPRLRRK